MSNFFGLRTGTIGNDFISLEYLVDAGPRIVRLYYRGVEENLLCEVPDRTHSTKYGTYYFRGGHRLWHAPEDIQRTYIPDNDPVTITQYPSGVILTQPSDPITGIQKSIEIKISPISAKIHLIHTLTNTGLWPITLSAWAITQLPLGGLAILPQPTAPLDICGLLPNRNLSIWPYTSINDPRMTLYDDAILIKARSALPPLKIGYTNRTGWVAYHRNSTLFIKHFTLQVDQPLPDMGCNTEVYCGDSFIELETLSPLTEINPGQSYHHTEIWEIIPWKIEDGSLEDIRHLVKQLIDQQDG